MRRVCSACRRELRGRRGHGFVYGRGRQVRCSSCAYPHKLTKREREELQRERLHEAEVLAHLVELYADRRRR